MQDDGQSVLSCEIDVQLSCLMNDRYSQRAFDQQVVAEEVASIGMWNGCVVIQEDGRVFWSHQVPEELQQKLLQTQSTNVKPEYVVLGPGNYYFLRLSDESIHFQGPVNFCQTIEQHKDKQVKLVAFGPNQSWFILYENGWSEWNDLPNQLYKTLNGATYDIPDLEYLAMGPLGQWFLRFENGSCRVFIQNKEILAELREINRRNGQIEVIAFGKKDTYCILHSNIIDETDDINEEEDDDEIIGDADDSMEVDDDVEIQCPIKSIY
eukprot:TRINITY_DN6717_c0_g3_i1.p1 TRINITY_DN6717_c0_g3~~TRINITY_DN6717_c0_g3_i1.p1  ORF type:complete len:266 (+),score=45.61 TRINITY_DN6717_c0_g3_i1:79-876(+)